MTRQIPKDAGRSMLAGVVSTEMSKDSPRVEIEGVEYPEWSIFTASTSAENRRNDIIDQNSWLLDPFKANPVGLWMHNLMQPPIARLEVWVEDEGTETARLMVKFFWDLADPEARSKAGKVDRGLLNAVSVHLNSGSMQWRDELPQTDPRYSRKMGFVRTQNELREISLVTVPGDSTAIKHSIASLSALSQRLNTPAEQPPMPTRIALLSLLLTALSMPEDTSEEDTLAAVKDLKKSKDEQELALLSALSVEALPDDLGAALAAATDKSGMITLAESQRLTAEALAGAGPSPEDSAKSAVLAGIEQGTILPGYKDVFLSMAGNDPEGCLLTVSKLGTVAPLTRQKVDKEATPDSSQTLSEVERKFASEAGLTDEEYLAGKTEL